MGAGQRAIRVMGLARWIATLEGRLWSSPDDLDFAPMPLPDLLRLPDHYREAVKEMDTLLHRAVMAQIAQQQ